MRAGAPRAALAALAALLALTVAACGPKPAAGPESRADVAWRAFSAARAAAAATPAFLATGSLNYAGPGRSLRVELQFWGDRPGALRMDMSAGFGTPVALWAENADGIRGYFPLERALYTHPDPRAGAARMGPGIPLSLTDLAALALGSYAGLVPAGYERAEAQDDGAWRYTFSGRSPVAALTLDAAGRPMVLAGRLVGRAWTLSVADWNDETSPPAPSRFRLELDGGAKAVIRVKSLERRAAPWPAERLTLDVPDDTRLVPLDLVQNLSK